MARTKNKHQKTAFDAMRREIMSWGDESATIALDNAVFAFGEDASMSDGVYESYADNCVDCGGNISVYWDVVNALRGSGK